VRLESEAQWVAATSCMVLNAEVRQAQQIPRRHVTRNGNLPMKPNNGGKSLSGANHGRYKNGFWTQEAVIQRKKGNLSALAILIMFELEELIAKHGGANIP